MLHTHSVDKMKLDGENIPHTGSAFKTLANDGSKATLITRAPNIWYTHNTNFLHDEPPKVWTLQNSQNSVYNKNMIEIFLAMIQMNALRTLYF